MERSRGKILVIRGGAIGDFILTLPVLSALRQQFPQTHIEVLGYPHIVQLAMWGGLADAVKSIEARPLAGFFARNGELDEELQDYFSEFALIVSYLFDPDRIFQTNIARCSKAQFISGPHRPSEDASAHATQIYLEPLQRIAIFDADSVPRLEAERAPRRARPDDDSWLALHPGSGSEKKNWPEAQWAQLLEAIVHSTDLNLLLVGGEAEENRLERLASPLPRTRVKIARSLPLTELAERLRDCAAFVGHDSGISHLAAAIGMPSLILWGDTAEAVWRPQGERITIIRAAGGLSALEVDCVLNALQNLLR